MPSSLLWLVLAIIFRNWCLIYKYRKTKKTIFTFRLKASSGRKKKCSHPHQPMKTDAKPSQNSYVCNQFCCHSNHMSVRLPLRPFQSMVPTPHCVEALVIYILNVNLPEQRFHAKFQVARNKAVSSCCWQAPVHYWWVPFWEGKFPFCVCL